MKQTLILYFFLVFTLISQGCNSIYFYETQKYSLTIEGRPDVTSPASFNLGIKHRIAAVVPEKGENKEAVSLISYFNLVKASRSGLFNDPILVETVLISGKAASNLVKDNKQADSVAKVLNVISRANNPE